LARGESEDERRLFPVPVGRLMSREHGWIMTSLLNLFSLAIARRRIAASKNPDWKRLGRLPETVERPEARRSEELVVSLQMYDELKVG
jgi:hypothetical protein